MTNNIHELRFDSIMPDLKVNGTKQLFQKISMHVSKLIGTPEKFVFDTLIEQERQQSSGIGQGVAIPHMKLPRLTKPVVIFAKLSRNIEFNAVDKEPVDLVCVVLSPSYDGPKHLRRLAKVTRFLSDAAFCESLRNANDVDDIRMVLKEVNSRRMAA